MALWLESTLGSAELLQEVRQRARPNARSRIIQSTYNKSSIFYSSNRIRKSRHRRTLTGREKEIPAQAGGQQTHTVYG